jgi:phosphatidylglycerol:prolipoprotein diacylglycerol transferase
MNVLEVFDYFSPTLGLGLAITRIGCFLNGCCFGLPTKEPWGISFPPGSIPYSVFQSLPLQPTQLYSSLYGLVIFLLLHFKMKHKQFTGQLVAILFMVEAVFRFFIEDLRYYEQDMTFKMAGVTVTYNQVIAVVLFAIGLGMYLYLRRRSQKIQPAVVG